MDTKALRQKVLDLAIRGKLVPQDPNDEPASVLLERIRQQKQQMVKGGNLKAKDIKNDSIIFVGEDNLHYEKFANGSVKCIEDEIPFDLPDGWAWARLQSITSLLTDGTHKTPKYSGDGYIFLSSRNVTSGRIDWDNIMYIPEALHQELYARLAPKVGDILLAKNGTTGVAAIVDREEAFDIYVSLALIRIVENTIDPLYVLRAIGSSYIQDYFNSSLKGIGVPNLHLEHIRKTLLPIPPYSEQNRIVSRVDLLLPLLEQIADDEKELHRLVSASKAKILNLAIRGQLVPQDPADEPASVLLERIRAEKEELIRQGKIKRDKRESVIFRGEDNSYYVRQDTHTESIDDQFIFDLPDNWNWCSLLNVAKIELGKTLDSVKNTGTNHPYLRSVNVRWNEVDLADLKEMRFEPEEIDRYTVRRNDLLICEGGDVGRSCVWTDEKEILYQNALHRVRFYGECNPFYFMYYMMYYESRGIIKALCKGVTIKHLTGNVLSLIPFALPPLEEQGRIVERLNQIFALLDTILCD